MIIIKQEPITETINEETVALLQMSDENQQWWIDQYGKIFKRYFKPISREWKWSDETLEFSPDKKHKMIGQDKVSFTQAKIIASAWIPTNTEQKLFAKIIDPNKPVSKDNVLWTDDNRSFSPATDNKIYQDTEQYTLDGEEFRIPIFIKSDKRTLQVLDEFDKDKHISIGECPEISNFGRVRKKGIYHIGHGRQNNYLFISLGSMGTFGIHTVLIQTFPEDTYNSHEGGPRPFMNASVDHVDQNTRNNNRTNLRWASPTTQSANRAISKQNQINSVNQSGGGDLNRIGIVAKKYHITDESQHYLSILEEYGINGVKRDDALRFFCGMTPEQIKIDSLPLRDCLITTFTSNIYAAMNKIPFHLLKNEHWNRLYITDNNIESLKTLIHSKTPQLDEKVTLIKLFLDEKWGLVHDSPEHEKNWARAKFVKLYVNKYTKEIHSSTLLT